jgi:hypothetical protein
VEKKWQYSGAIHKLFIDFRKAHVSVRREVSYNIPILFGIPWKLVGINKMHLNETYSIVLIGRSVTGFLSRMT